MSSIRLATLLLVSLTAASGMEVCVTSRCYEPGRCDVPCQCSGRVRSNDLCYDFEPAFSYQTFIMACLLLFLFVVERILAWRYHIYNFLRKSLGCLPFCDRLQPELRETIHASNPNTGKSAAFTITTRDFNPQSGDPDLDLAIEMSLRHTELQVGTSSDHNMPSTSGIRRDSDSSRRSISFSTVSSDYGSVTSHRQSSNAGVARNDSEEIISRTRF